MYELNLIRCQELFDEMYSLNPDKVGNTDIVERCHLFKKWCDEFQKLIDIIGDDYDWIWESQEFFTNKFEQTFR